MIRRHTVHSRSPPETVVPRLQPLESPGTRPHIPNASLVPHDAEEQDYPLPLPIRAVCLPRR